MLIYDKMDIMDQLNVRDVYTKFQLAYANYHKRPYRIPKKWDSIEQKPDWRYFVQLTNRAQTHLSLVDLDNFFKANLEMRAGSFRPPHFSQYKSFQNYVSWTHRPPALSDEKLLKKSMTFLMTFLRREGKSLYDYFNSSDIYPLPLRHFAQGNLHQWIMVYYIRHYGGFYNTPRDILYHSFGAKNDEDYDNKLDTYWLQFINSESRSLIEQFFDKFYKKA